MSDFETRLNGTLHGLMRWSDWDKLQTRLLHDTSQRWYAYAIGTDVPATPVPAAKLRTLLSEIDALLRRDLDGDTLGIIYVDDADTPTLIKIYDPNNLGSTCGSIGFKVLPGWILSLDPPSLLDSGAPLPGNRSRWWAKLLTQLKPG